MPRAAGTSPKRAFWMRAWNHLPQVFGAYSFEESRTQLAYAAGVKRERFGHVIKRAVVVFDEHSDLRP